MAQDEDLPPPKADFSAPPPYELSPDNSHNHQHHQSTETPADTLLPNPDDYRNHPPQQHQQQMQCNNNNNTNHTNNNNPNDPVIVVVESPALPSKLPTYEEVQMEKTRLGEMPMDLQNTFPSIHGRIPPPSHPVLISALRNAHAHSAATGGPPGSVAVGPNGTLTFISIDDGTGQSQGRHHLHHHHAGATNGITGGVGTGVAAGGALNVDNSLLGTDFMFLAAFIVAFLFNWIGFLMLTCFFHTIAARYGALSGFGLSLAKWTLIVKKSTDLASHDSSWLWWLIMSFGCLICVRALVQYVSIKRTWRMMSASAQERLLFFY